MSISGVFIASALKAGIAELSVSMSHILSVREPWPFRSADGRSGELGRALNRTTGVGSAFLRASSASGVRGWNGGTGVSKHGTDVESGSRSSVSKSRIEASARVASPTSTRRFLGRATGVEGWWLFGRGRKASRGVEFSLSSSGSLAGVAGEESGSKRARTLCRGRFMFELNWLNLEALFVAIVALSLNMLAVRAEIKLWEKAFRAANGRDPTVDDIRAQPDIGSSFLSSSRSCVLLLQSRQV